MTNYMAKEMYRYGIFRHIFGLKVSFGFAIESFDEVM